MTEPYLSINAYCRYNIWNLEKKDNVLAVTALGIVELGSFQCSRRPVGGDKRLYINTLHGGTVRP
jgi:hypothetical protein